MTASESQRTPDGPFHETPLIKSYPISSTLPFQVYLKQEYTQPSGSFKSRGLGNLVRAKQAEAKSQGKQISLFSSSGGNAGLAAATAAAYYGLPCTVVLPTNSKPRMKSKIEQTGATVVVEGRHWNEADQYLKQQIIGKLPKSDVLPVYCHPFDDEIVWDGNSTLVDEIKYQLGDDLGKLKGVICSVGGGGLYAGVVRGLLRHELKVPVIAVETENAASLNRALQEGKVVHLDSLNTIATSLASPFVAEQALTYAQNYPTHSVLVSDDQSLASASKFANDHNVVVEPACGAALTPVYEPSILEKTLGKLSQDDIVVVVVCGGSSYAYKDLLDV